MPCAVAGRKRKSTDTRTLRVTNGKISGTEFEETLELKGRPEQRLEVPEEEE